LAQRKTINRYKDRKILRKDVQVNKIVETPVTSTCLSVDSLELKTDCGACSAHRCSLRGGNVRNKKKKICMKMEIMLFTSFLNDSWGLDSAK
jgi:hypothetical protein